MVAALVALGPLRGTLESLPRALRGVVVAEPWTAYYVESDIEQGQPVFRLRFSSGSLPGTPTQPALVSSALIVLGGWSADGSMFALAAGTRVHVADGQGGVRELGDIGGRRTRAIGWLGGDVIGAIAEEEPGAALVRIDARTGAAERLPVPSYHDLGLFSPDGRWLASVDLRASAVDTTARRPIGLARTVLLELASGRETTAPPGVTVAGWLPDGRLLVRRVVAGRQFRIETWTPGDEEPSGVVAELRAQASVVVEAPDDRVFLTEEPPERRPALWRIREGEEPLRMFELPERTAVTGVSREGRYAAVTTTITSVRGPTPLRVGVLDLETGEVTFACERDCIAIDVR